MMPEKTPSSFLQGTRMPSAMIKVVLRPSGWGQDGVACLTCCLLHVALCWIEAEPVVDPPSCCIGRGKEKLSSSERWGQDIADGNVEPLV